MNSYKQAANVIKNLANIYGNENIMVVLGNHDVCNLFFEDPQFQDGAINGQIYNYGGGSPHYDCVVVLDPNDIPQNFRSELKMILHYREGVSPCFVEMDVTPPDRSISTRLRVA